MLLSPVMRRKLKTHELAYSVVTDVSFERPPVILISLLSCLCIAGRFAVTCLINNTVSKLRLLGCDAVQSTTEVLSVTRENAVDLHSERSVPGQPLRPSRANIWIVSKT